MNDLLNHLIRRLDAGSAERARLDAYYAGNNPLTYLSAESRTALGDRLARVSVNIPKLLVDAISERLAVTAITGVDVWADWTRNDLDQVSGVVHREAMTLGNAYALVWADTTGRPVVSAESADQVTTLTDPATGATRSAIKRWGDDKVTTAVVYEPDVITRYEAPTINATGGFKVAAEIANPLGVVPVVRFKNGGRLLEDGVSEMESVLTLADANTKLLTDMLVASEATARPRRFATGIELEEDDEGNAVNPIPENNKAMVSENPDARFGSLPGSDLAGYEAGVGVIMRQVSAVSGLPEHMLGIGGDNPTSADSIRASEAALTARAEAKQAAFGRSWEEVARLMAAIRANTVPGGFEARVQWRDASTRSIAQEADAVVKLVAAGILPPSFALARLGYDATEIAAIRTARRAEALDAAGVDLASLLPREAAS